jgi:drug/metabolite transporter (DMT)-like permease
LTAVALAAVSAALFGAMSVGLRIGLDRNPDAELATLATVTGALVVTLVAAAAESPARGLHLTAAWPFLLAGLMQPGAGQIFVTRSVQEAGASRASVVLGSAPLVSVTIALVLLGEPAEAPLLVGAVLIVAGGVELARDRGRPAHVRRRGYLFAFIACVLFATRDNLVRWLSGDTSAPPAVAAAAALAGGLALVVVLLGRRVGDRLEVRPALPFLGVGLIFGLSYIALFEAYFRGRVSVVSPIVATEALWGVALSWLLIRHTELVGVRVVLGAVLIVTGGVLIGIYAG